VTATEVVHTDDKEFVGIDRLAGTDHVVPPAHVLGAIGVIARDMMIPRQRVADQNRVGLSAFNVP